MLKPPGRETFSVLCYSSDNVQNSAVIATLYIQKKRIILTLSAPAKQVQLDLQQAETFFQGWRDLLVQMQREELKR